MTCFASSGTGIPQSNVVREMERSSSGSRCKRARISLRHCSGLMKSGWLLMCSMSRSWYLPRRCSVQAGGAARGCAHALRLLEEVGRLEHLLQRLARHRVLELGGGRLGLRHERLLAHVVPARRHGASGASLPRAQRRRAPALVASEVDVARSQRLAEDELAALLVDGRRGPVVHVVADVQPRVQLLRAAICDSAAAVQRAATASPRLEL